MRTLVARSPRGQANAPGCVGFFGVPFLLAGAFLLAFRSGADEGGTGKLVLMAIGVTFLMAGALLVQRAVRSAVARRRLARARSERPEEPWLWDYPWTFPVLRLPALSPLAGGFLGLLFLTVFLAPFNLLAPFPASLIVWFFDALAVCGWGYLVYQVLQGLKYGSSYLRLLRLPFFLGETLDVRLGGAGRLAGFRTLTVALRCFEEHVERSSRAGRSQQAWKVYCRHKEVRTLKPEDVGYLGRPARLLSLTREADETTELPISFELPGDRSLRSDLSSPEPVYWELEVTAEVPGIDFKAAFVVPVYGR